LNEWRPAPDTTLWMNRRQLLYFAASAVAQPRRNRRTSL
jgi:hypothetical protein